ncbi:peptidoglycan editing factor PgeF [uncultured Brachyspira sp.]|uniref:peptidoglycan editing factor PgeF n=1 Tax=uncultured Brachyspira sp. TaxID=221953 RepID=UPI002600AFD6|nr:peptidoglycan editing factor PgeF [uncultured Brachyspira sp.]
MNNIFYPLKNNKQKIHISVLSKGKNINAEDITLEYRKKIEDEFFKYINFDINKAVFMHQVHKNNIVKIDESNIHLFGSREKLVKDTDALITNIKNIPLIVQTADCVPIILYCDESKSMAAIHSGWRGTAENITSKTIELMKKEYSINLSKMYAYIGPYIAQKDYEVGDEVAVHFKNKTIINNKWHIDNGLEVKNQMIECGILEKNIELSNLNTYDEEFYSYRRDGVQIGRMLTLGVIL